MIWFTSDLHFNHDRAFVYKPRGFESVQEMNEVIVRNWNSVVGEEDDVYCLGDLMLGDYEAGLKLIKQLNGAIHIVLGNHDTDNRERLYAGCYNVVEIALAMRFKLAGYHFFLTHYPCITSNLEKEDLKKCTCNLYGHTHQKTNFYNDIPFMYHVGLDSHNCTPVSYTQVIADMNAKYKECIEVLGDTKKCSYYAENGKEPYCTHDCEGCVWYV